MSFLRVMTFNMQLLPEIEVPIFQIQLMPTSGNESEARAGYIGDAIAALPADELPDVLVGNEVFNEDARKALVQRISPLYKHIVPIFQDSAQIALIGTMNLAISALFQDSGLFFASKWPILPQRDGQTARFARYVNATGWDAFSAKGVGIVTIASPIGPVTFAFSHTQASGAAEDENRDIRAQQLLQIEAELSAVVGAPPTSWHNVVVLGDLNIRGDLQAVSNEWAATFSTGSSVFTTVLTDGWRSFMRPPLSPVEVDPGFTNNNLESGEGGAMPAGMLSRLDYILTAKPGPRVLTPQHMRTRFRHLSDHWSLEADLHRFSPACTPSTAVRLSTISALPSGLRSVPMRLTFDGSYQWIYVGDRGTYTIFPPVEAVDVAVFSADDLSTQRQPYVRVNPASLGLPQLNAEVHGGRAKLGPVGEQYEVPGPFFIRLRSRARTAGYVGPCTVGVLRHRGETPATAITLRPYDQLVDPELPLGHVLGLIDECWFRAEIDRAVSAATHESSFELWNDSGGGAAIELMDSGFAKLGTAAGNEPVLHVTHSTVGPEVVFLVLRRSTTAQVAFLAGWKSGLTYLRSDPKLRPLGLRCLDETGPDWAGADEITLKLRADGMIPFFLDTYWDDADANEFLALDAKVPVIAFADALHVWINESDFFQSSPSVVDVQALSAMEPPTREIMKSIDIQTGTYRFEGMLSRWRD